MVSFTQGDALGAAFFRTNNNNPPRKKRSKERETNKKQKTKPNIFICAFKAWGCFFLLGRLKSETQLKPIILICLFETWGCCLFVIILFWLKLKHKQFFLICFSLKQAHHLHLLVRHLGLDRTTIEVLKQKSLAWTHSLSVIGFIIYQIMFQL